MKHTHANMWRTQEPLSQRSSPSTYLARTAKTDPHSVRHRLKSATTAVEMNFKHRADKLLRKFSWE